MWALLGGALRYLQVHSKKHGFCCVVRYIVALLATWILSLVNVETFTRAGEEISNFTMISP